MNYITDSEVALRTKYEADADEITARCDAKLDSTSDKSVQRAAIMQNNDELNKIYVTYMLELRKLRNESFGGVI